MLSVDAALRLILDNAKALPVRPVALHEAVGLVLAEDIVSDLDMPPFKKAMMDGYAVRSADLASGNATLRVVEEITAGKTPTVPVGPGQASRIMTGAPIPEGADAVVMIERATLQGDAVTIQDKPAKPEQHILERGAEMRLGEAVVTSGSKIRPQELGVLATVGRTEVRAIPAARVGILSTGDEIVEPSTKPGPGQIRNGSASMILGQTLRAGARPTLLGIAKDNVDSLQTFIRQGLELDVLVLMGGVSAGKLDLVPEVLSQEGVVPLFHKVSMKPGKPLFFGKRNDTLVFGLPGNPVSSFVGFELFVRPALRQLSGRPPGPTWSQATWETGFCYKTDRPTFHPVWVESNGVARKIPWFGSPDLKGVLASNALAFLDVGERVYQAGDVVRVLRIEDPD